ncbi:MAG: hypothetical protein Q9173_003546 [Seirophora scorigena]
MDCYAFHPYRVYNCAPFSVVTPTSDTQGVTQERTMLPPRSEKKRLVSRPLSPTHKRHKPAQSTQQTQPSVGVNTRLLSGKQDSRDVSPKLQPSQFNDSTKQREVPSASALTHELVIRSRPLVAELDYKAGEARSTSLRPRLPYQTRVSEKLATCGLTSNAEEKKPTRAVNVRAANDSTKPPYSPAQRTQWYWASEMPAVRDHILKARKERAKAARTKAVKKAKMPTSPSSLWPAITAPTATPPPESSASISPESSISPSPETSVSPSPPLAPSPLDLGSPDSIGKSPPGLRLVHSRSGNHSLNHHGHLNGGPLATSAFSNARTVSKVPERHGSFDRSSCPSPDPPPQYEGSTHGVLPDPIKTIDPAPTIALCNSSRPESVSTCGVANGDQRKCPTGFSNCLDQTIAKMTIPYLTGTLDRGYDKPHSMNPGTARVTPTLSCKVPVGAGNTSGACPAWNDSNRDNQPGTGVWDAKSEDPLLRYWNEAIWQFQAPEPLIVFTVTVNDATVQDVSVGRDGGGDNPAGEGPNQQQGTSDPRHMPEEPTAHVQGTSNDGLNQQQGTSDPRNVPEGSAAHVQRTSNDSEHLESFPDITESLLQYHGSTTVAGAGSAGGPRSRRATTLSSDDGCCCCLPCFRGRRIRSHVTTRGGPIALDELQVEAGSTAPAPQSDYRPVGYAQDDQTEELLNIERSLAILNNQSAHNRALRASDNDRARRSENSQTLRNDTADTTGESSTGTSTAPTAASPHQQQVDPKMTTSDNVSSDAPGEASAKSRRGSDQAVSSSVHESNESKIFRWSTRELQEAHDAQEAEKDERQAEQRKSEDIAEVVGAGHTA